MQSAIQGACGSLAEFHFTCPVRIPLIQALPTVPARSRVLPGYILTRLAHGSATGGRQRSPQRRNVRHLVPGPVRVQQQIGSDRALLVAPGYSCRTTIADLLQPDA